MNLGNFARSRRLSAVAMPALWLFASSRICDLFNAYIGLYFVPRFIDTDNLGAVLPLTQAALIVATPLSIILVPYVKILNVHAERGEYGKVKAMIRDCSIMALCILILALAVTPFFLGYIFRVFAIENGRLAYAIIISGVIGALAPVFTETLRALKRFGVAAFTSLVNGPLRLAAMALLLPLRGLTGYFAAQSSVPIFDGAVAVFDFLRRHRQTHCEPYWREDKNLFIAFCIPLVFITVLSNIRGMMELLPLSQVPAVESAAYYQLTRFTEIASYIGATVVYMVFPLVSARHEKGSNTRRMLICAMAFTFIGGLACSVLLALVGPLLLDNLSFLKPYTGYSRYFLLLGLLPPLRMTVSCYTTHEMACGRFRFAFFNCAVYAIEILFMYIMLKAPSSIRAVFGLGSWSLQGIVAVMIVFAALTLLACALDMAIKRGSRKVATNGEVHGNI